MLREFRNIWGRQELGGNVEIRQTRERLRRSAADIGPLTCGNPYMASRRIAPTYGEPQDCSDGCAAGQCARLMHRLLPSRFRGLPVDRQNGISSVQLLGR